MKTFISFSCKFALVLLISLFTLQAQAQDPSAILDLESTTQGMLAPRMTTVDRLALPGIHTPAASLLVYDTDTKSFWYWEDGIWNELGSQELESGFMPTSSTNSASGDSINNSLPPVIDTITLTDPGTITADLNVVVCLDIVHTYVSDLQITLTAPDGSTTIDLTSGNGLDGDNFEGTCFADYGLTSITSASPSHAPFSSIYRPEDPLSNLIGQSIAGDWILTIVDNAGGDEGRFVSWSLNIGTGEPLLANILSDADGDTKIEVERTLDEDIVRLHAGGVEKMKISSTEVDINGLVKVGALTSEFISNNGQLINIGPITSYGPFSGFGISNAGPINNTGTITCTSPVGTPGLNMSQNDSYADLRVIRNTLSPTDNNLYFNFLAGIGSEMAFYSDDFRTMTIAGNQLLVGTTTGATGYKVSVDGKIACEEVLVDLNGDWPDYVFKSDYELKTLKEVKQHIDEKGHLPGVPSAQEIEDNGIVLGEMNKVLMEKIEELTLYILQQEDKNKAQDARLKLLENSVKE